MPGTMPRPELLVCKPDLPRCGYGPATYGLVLVIRRNVLKGDAGMRTKAMSSVLLTVAMAGLALSLAACDEAEQGRVLRYEKGTYLGEKDTGLSVETLDDLRSRASLQRGM